jgi:hypothetical protein
MYALSSFAKRLRLQHARRLHRDYIRTDYHERRIGQRFDASEIVAMRELH